MHDDLERAGESPAASSVRPQARTLTLDAVAALRLAEAAAGSHLYGEPEQTSGADPLLVACERAAERAERAGVVLRAEALAAARPAMRRIARARLGVVAHAIAGDGSEELSALTDVGWGVLSASGPEDSFDLTLIARRAAEDSGVPFVVVHALGGAGPAGGRAIAMATLPHEQTCREFIGTMARLVAAHDPSHPSLMPLSDRLFAERVPFALGSAFREYGSVSGRRHDVFDKTPLGEPPLMLVGVGPVGDALFHAVSELRARGYDVGAVHLNTLRPFPGARLVKCLSRALAVTVLEPAYEPLAQAGLVTRELKAAFTDALTWAPGFPGIGRIPKLYAGVTGPAFDLGDLSAACDNMLADERGKRSFSFVPGEHALPRSPRAEGTETGLSVRLVLDDVALAEAAVSTTASVLGGLLGLRVQAILTSEESSVSVDLHASRESARGGMARRRPRLLLATEKGTLLPDATARLSQGAVVGLLVAGAEGAAVVPEGARALARDRGVRVLPLDGSARGIEPRAAVAAACAGAVAAVAARVQRATLDAGQVGRLAAEHLAGLGLAGLDIAADRGRRAFEATQGASAGPDASKRGVVPSA